MGPVYRRVLLKLSGQALSGPLDFGLHAETVMALAEQVRDVVAQGTEVAIVLGGGNFWRGAPKAAEGMDRVTADTMGMLATVMNALFLQDALQRLGVEVRCLTAVPMPSILETYQPHEARRHLAAGRVVLCAGGTGNPLMTTDTAAALRAAELEAEVLLMAKHQVDGVYEADPRKVPDARRFTRLTYQEALIRRLAVMDGTALTLCEEHAIPIIVFDINAPGSLVHIIAGEPVGTLVAAS